MHASPHFPFPLPAPFLFVKSYGLFLIPFLLFVPRVLKKETAECSAQILVGYVGGKGRRMGERSCKEIPKHRTVYNPVSFMKYV